MRDHKTALNILRQAECKLYFDNCVDVKIYYNKYYKCYITKNHSPTIRHIRGSFPAFREHLNFKHGIGKVLDWVRAGCNLVKYNNYIGTVNVPEDSCIICNKVADVLVIMSHSAGRVLKLETHCFAQQLMDSVSIAASKFSAAGLKQHNPDLYAFGRLENSNIYYTSSKFCADSLPFLSSWRGKQWPKTFESYVLPILQKFHDKNGTILATGADWSQHISAKFEGKEMPAAMRDAMQSCMDRLSEVAREFMPIGLISLDLQPQNVHLDGDHCVILDWSNSKDAALIIDVMCDVFYKAKAKPELEVSVEYWNFIIGNITLDQCNTGLSSLAQIWLEWMSRWQNLSLDESDFRLQLEGACWDWLGTSIYPFDDENCLRSHQCFPDYFLQACNGLGVERV